jgi:hypothetical protein
MPMPRRRSTCSTATSARSAPTSPAPTPPAARSHVDLLPGRSRHLRRPRPGHRRPRRLVARPRRAHLRRPRLPAPSWTGAASAPARPPVRRRRRCSPNRWSPARRRRDAGRRRETGVAGRGNGGTRASYGATRLWLVRTFARPWVPYSDHRCGSYPPLSASRRRLADQPPQEQARTDADERKTDVLHRR